MDQRRETRLLPYPPDVILDLVADVERYPDFLPWVADLRVLSREDLDDGREKLVAEMRVSFKVYSEKFVTGVVIDRAARRIDIDYRSGPFKRLENIWRFTETQKGGCKIDFFIAFEFRSKLFQLAARRFVDLAVGKLAQSFEARAHALNRRGRLAQFSSASPLPSGEAS